jgi:hypothetical protein
MSRSAKANLVAVIVLVGFFMSVAFHYVMGVHLRMPYPHNTFLFNPMDRYADFYSLLDWNRNLNPYLRSEATAQYPLLNLLSYALSTLDPDSSLILFNCVVIAALLWLNGVALYGENKASLYLNTAVITLLTYPFLFTIDRGNFESLLGVFLLLFAYCYQRGHYQTAALCLSFPIAMKLFPAVLLVLFISDRRYKAVLQAILWATLLTLASLAVFEGGFYQNLMAVVSGRNLTGNHNVSEFTGNNDRVQRGVSLFSVLKMLILAAGKMESTDMGRALHLYILSMACMSVPIILYVVFVETRLWKKVTLLVFMMLLFPQISAEYKLLHVLVPLLLFINAPTGSRIDHFYAAGFGLLLIAKDYVLLGWVHSEGNIGDISVNMLMNPILMLAMMLVVMATGLRECSWARIRMILAAHWRALAALLWRFPGGMRARRAHPMG